jgi:uncharacterized protein
MKKIPFTLTIGMAMITSIAAGQIQDTLKTGSEKIESVGIRDVHLTDNFWLPIIETVQRNTIAYALNKCEEEGRLENFLIAGGEMEGTTRGVMPFDDTDIYKIIEGASSSLISSPNPELEARLDEIIAIIAVGQEEDGYLTTWRTIDGMHPSADWVEPGPRWHHLAASHELYNGGHLFEAAAQHYAATGKTNLLNIATGYADLLVETFGPGKLETVPGHQIVETGLIKLYRITGKKAYLELAKYFLDNRGVENNRKSFGPYSQDHLPVVQQDEVVGHAVRAVYMYAGMTDIAELYQDQDYFHAVEALWNNMVNKKLYITGGIGARHEGESFGDNYELPNLTAYAETCASIGSVIWNQRLFQITGDKAYYDVLERTLYNGTISGISLNGTRFFYPNCLEADGEYAFNQGHCTRAEWFGCSCCPTNLIRFIPSIPSLIYGQNGNNILINLYASSEARMTVDEQEVKLTQTTNYPWAGDVDISLEIDSRQPITLKLRIPGWAANQPVPGDLYHYIDSTDTKIGLKLNGKPVDYKVEGGYLAITRKWGAKDILSLSIPMPVRKVVANPLVKDLEGLVALERGPLVYCLESPDNTGGLKDISIAEETVLTPHKSDMLGGVVTLEGQSPEGEKITAIPYYAWANRGVTSMKVWLPRESE